LTININDVPELVFDHPGAIIVDASASCLIIDDRIEHAPICVVLAGEHVPTKARTFGAMVLGRLAAEELIRQLANALDGDLATHPELQPPHQQGEPS
jgi:hypothetical protein